jgi:3-oxo-5alpha-steroid 4-dehydrogenase
MHRFLMAAMGPQANEERISAYCEGSVEHFEWLSALGVEFKPTMWDQPAWTPPTDDGLMWIGENSYPFDELARPAPRGHRPRGSGRVGNVLMGVLLAALDEVACPTRVDSRVDRLVVDTDGGVVGVVARQEGADVHIRARRGVILCAGGFAFNDQMLTQHAPRLLPHTRLGTDHDDGAGIRMAQAVGAAAVRMDAGEASINFAPALMARSILVDARGQRFVNEDTYGGRIGQLALYQRDARAYLIFDETALDDVPPELRHGRQPQWVCASVSELEGELGLPPRSLELTLELYNHHAAKGEDPQFHKRARWLRPIGTPIGAMDVRAKRADGPPDPADRGTGFRVFTLGGLETSTDGEVLDVQGEPIPGLYAAGRTASGICAWGYISGTSLGDGTYFGRRAGAAAARS